MSLFKNPEKAKLRDARKDADADRERTIRLAKPVLKAFGRGPVAVVVMKGANEQRKALLRGLKHSYPPTNVLQLKGRRVQRVDTEREHVDVTFEKLEELRQKSTGPKGRPQATLVIFGGIQFPQPETIDRIGRGTPEVVERITAMIENPGPNDPHFLFMGNGTPSDLPSTRDFPRDLDRGILNTVGITYALHPDHGLTTVLPAADEVSMAHRRHEHFREGGSSAF